MADERIDILIAARNQTSGAISSVNRDLASVGKAASDASKSTTSALGDIDKAANALSGGLAGIGAAAFGIGSVVGLLQNIGAEMSELARRGAVVGQLGDVFEDYAASVGTSSDAVLDAMKKASQGTIAESELILSANKAIQFQVAQTPQALAKLVELSSALGRAQGISDQDALGFLTTGIARESKLILDNLGLIIDVEAATEDYAASLGKTAAQLSEAERKQALLNEAFRQGKVALEANREAGDSPATRIEKFDAASQDAREQIGLGIANVFSDEFAGAALSLQKFNEWMEKGAVSSGTLREQLRLVVAERDALVKVGTFKPFGIDLSATFGDIKLLNILIDELEGRIEDARDIEKLSSRQSAVTAPTKPLTGIQEIGQALAAEGVPPIIDEIVNRLTKIPVAAREAGVSLDSIGGTSFSEIAKNVTELKDSFDDLDKVQKSVQSSITNNAIKASDVIGDERAFALAGQQIEEFDEKLKALTSQALTGEIEPGEFLFKLQTLPAQATEIFSQVTAAAKDGGVKLQEELSNTINLRDAFALGGNDAGVSQLNEKISSIVRVLNIVNPAAMAAADGFGELGNSAITADSQLASIVTNAGGAGSATASMGTDAGNAATDVYALNAALAAAPPALAAAGSAMIAAGMDAATAAAMVSGLRAEFALLEGAQAGARRAIINRAAGVASIVGDQKALDLANQQIAQLDGSIAGLQQQVIDGTLSQTELEFQTALLGETTTSTFDEIEEADRKAQQLARGGLSAASKAAKEAEKDFESLKGQVAGVLSGSLSLDVGVDTEKILGREDAINEDARRLADVAVKGFESPWADYLRDKFPEMFGDAFAPGQDIKKAAADALRAFQDGLVPELLDKEAAKARVRRALIGEANMAALATEIATELSAEFGGKISLGQIQATAGATLGVDGAETEQLTKALTGAASGVQAQLAGLGGSLKTGILSAMEGIGAAVASSIDKQFKAEGNLKLVEGAGYLNGIAWGKGFLTSMDNLSTQTLEKLAALVQPFVSAEQRRDATLQGAN
jgi:hypothetical protein